MADDLDRPELLYEATQIHRFETPVRCRVVMIDDVPDPRMERV